MTKLNTLRKNLFTVAFALLALTFQRRQSRKKRYWNLIPIRPK